MLPDGGRIIKIHRSTYVPWLVSVLYRSCAVTPSFRLGSAGDHLDRDLSDMWKAEYKSSIFSSPKSQTCLQELSRTYEVVHTFQGNVQADLLGAVGAQIKAWDIPVYTTVTCESNQTKKRLVTGECKKYKNLRYCYRWMPVVPDSLSNGNTPVSVRAEQSVCLLYTSPSPRD